MEMLPPAQPTKLAAKLRDQPCARDARRNWLASGVPSRWSAHEFSTTTAPHRCSGNSHDRRRTSPACYTWGCEIRHDKHGWLAYGDVNCCRAPPPVGVGEPWRGDHWLIHVSVRPQTFVYETSRRHPPQLPRTLTWCCNATRVLNQCHVSTVCITVQGWPSRGTCGCPPPTSTRTRRSTR
jgi:hypothetical protein